MKYRKKPVVSEAIQWIGNNLKEIIDVTGLHSSATKWTWEEYKQVVKEKGLKIKFDTLLFSHGQYEQISQWHGDKNELLITVEQFQAKLDDKKKTDTKEIPFEED